MISNFLVGRLRTIASFVPQSCIMADIGCDHGLLSVGLSQHCSKVWAIDVSALAIQGEYFGIGLQSKRQTLSKIMFALGEH